MFKVYRMVAAECDKKVREILVMPSDSAPEEYETVAGQIKSFCEFFVNKLEDYKEAVSQTSVAVFAVNYVQNRFISTELSVEIHRLWQKMAVFDRDHFKRSLENLKTEPECASLISELESRISEYDSFIADIDARLDEQIGPSTTQDKDEDELPELGVQSQTITHYVKTSAFEVVLVVVVRSFSSSEVNQHILSLYDKMGDFHRMGCDVFLLTRGPPIASRGGSYIKLIGVPFRKLYEEGEAMAELKAHRRSARKLAGWDSLTQTVEISMSDQVSTGPDNGRKLSTSSSMDTTAYITQKGGTILVNRSGNILYKYIEEENRTWPSVDTIIEEVQRQCPPPAAKPRGDAPNKVESEVSAAAKTVSAEENKSCCTIL